MVILAQLQQASSHLWVYLRHNNNNIIAVDPVALIRH